jgi:SpoU rRNA Methylase family
VCPLLIGDGVENAWNAQAMAHAAAVFDWRCAFRDRNGLAADWREKDLGPPPSSLSLDEIRGLCDPIVAFDNAEGAVPLYGFAPGPAERLGLAVGNERRGLARDLVQACRHRVFVPMASRRVNCLNVAAAAAVGLFYLSRGGGGKLFTRADPNRNRPELLLVGGSDHVELGSTIRSAAAFGWRRAFVEDRAGAWFGGDRLALSEGRAAARRSKNSIRLVRVDSDRRYAFDEACVVRMRPGGRPLARANLARGPRQLVVLVDENEVDVAAEDWGRLARTTSHVTLDLAVDALAPTYHFRLASAISLAEVARQVGIRAPKVRRRPRPPVYDRLLRVLLEDEGEVVDAADLEAY